MKQYKKHDSYNLGYNNSNDSNNMYNNNKVYYLYNQRHGLYFKLYFLNNKEFPYKGYYNMEQEYGHWLQQSYYRYFL